MDASVRREACGAAAYAAAEVDAHAFESLVIAVAPGLTDTAVFRQLIAQTQAASRRASSVAGEFEPVITCGSPEWTIAAYARQADIYERLAHAIATATANPRFRDVIEPQVAPIQCLATIRRVLAVRTTRAAIAGPIHVPVQQRVAQRALDALILVPIPELQRCIAQQRRIDSSFAPFGLYDLRPFPLGAWGH